MKIAIGSDHAGVDKKAALARFLKKRGYKIMDVGTFTDESVDYPDYARKVAQAVRQKKAQRGVLLCGTGVGMSIAANKVSGIRAAVAWNSKIAALAAEHNDANVLCLSARFLKTADLRKILKAWLSTPFAGGRHRRRVNKIKALEN